MLINQHVSIVNRHVHVCVRVGVYTRAFQFVQQKQYKRNGRRRHSSMTGQLLLLHIIIIKSR